MNRKVRLVATGFQKYGTRSLVPGEKFTADQADAADMLATRVAVRDADAAFPDVQRVKVRTKRAYKRRDLRAED
jgi:hypothetical protein